jgi:hypothetical protein
MTMYVRSAIEEFASNTPEAAMQGWRSLAGHTGLALEEVAALAEAGELRCLFGADRRLLPQAELRSRFGGPRPDPANAIAALDLKRPGIDGRKALDELIRKRQSWTLP